MQQEIIKNQPGFTVMGLVIRTNNNNEMNPEAAKIMPLCAQYFSQNIASMIPNRKNPGITIDGFTNYASNEFGDYDYFIGEVVTKAEPVVGLTIIEVPEGRYVKFTTPKGKIPDIIINAWQKIWRMTPKDLGGTRVYRNDYEVFDQRAEDSNNAVIDIYVGIEAGN